MEAKEKCLEQWWIGRLDSHCREKRLQGVLICDLVADAEKRIAVHEKRAYRRVPAFWATNNKYVPTYKYKLVWEGYKQQEYVTNDYASFGFGLGKPDHLKTSEEG